MSSCFVISPIGKEGSDVREHADDVWKFIIKPSLDENNIDGHRADHLLEAGRITEQMYVSLLEQNFCIAVLTFHNPNVFYEVAIAQSAGKPVIMLIQKGTQIPFDLHNMRMIEYDLKPTPIFEKVYVRQLSQMIKNVQQTGWKLDVPFGVNLSPLGSTQTDFTLAVPAEKHFRTDDWLQLIQQAKSNFDIAAYGLTGWPTFPRLTETLAQAAARNCHIRVLTYSSDNPAFSSICNFAIMSSDAASMASRFEAARNFFRAALKGYQHFEIRSIRKGLLFQQIAFSDDELVLLPYMYSMDSGHCPVIRCKRTHPLYATARYEFDSLWTMNDPKIFDHHATP